MKNKPILTIIFFINLVTCLCAQEYINSKDLWKHVVNIDRLVWQERDGIKKVNKMVNDESFVRRIYLDITGKIATYEQMLEFRKSKDTNKRSNLINDLLSSPGYVSNFTVFWQDLLRTTQTDGDRFYHREFTRYIERFLSDNKSYDKIVHDLIMAEGAVEQNPGIAFYIRDRDTGPSDTFNATTRAFLGTRLGCAQCHNHRFDKWTQKEFYEASAYLQGIRYERETGPVQERNLGRHIKSMSTDKRYKGELSHYAKRLFKPSIARIRFSERKPYTFPDNYIYDNAKPGAVVKERIVFDYGNHTPKGETRREQFAHWLASKENPIFARVMTNRLWKRIMGVANMSPVDDYKDNIEIQNEALYKALGDIFISVDYDFKAFLSVLFNTEAYLYAYDAKNEFKQEQYKVQGAMLKRMSSSQLTDSLLVLQHGNVDSYIKLDPQYFEFEDELAKLITSYKKEVLPLIGRFVKENGATSDSLEPEIMDILFKYDEKVRELEDYYQINKQGLLDYGPKKNLAVLTKKTSKTTQKKSDMMMAEGSMTHAPTNGKNVQLAHYKYSDFMKVFGRSDSSAPNTNLNTAATMKQLLKLANSPECLSVAKADSYLMKNAMAKESVSERVSYLYYSIYGRAPVKAEVSLAVNYCKSATDVKRWSNYVVALINSPEFYFIK